MKKQQKQEELNQCIEFLKKNLSEGDTIYCIVRSSPSAMTHYIKLFIASNKNSILYITYKVSIALGRKINEAGEMIIKGGGMDMAHEAVYSISEVLYGNGYKLNYGRL